MSMTRTDFKAIAEIIRMYKLIHVHDDKKIHELILNLCPYFRISNPTFKREQFLRDCGYYQEG